MKKQVDTLKACTICPRKCGVNRFENEIGHCKTGRQAIVSCFHPHFGEEPELVGNHGSGTLFFSYCNLLCNFCQNFDISHLGDGRSVTDVNIMPQYRPCGRAHQIEGLNRRLTAKEYLTAIKNARDQGLTRVMLLPQSGRHQEAP
jgi:putative pyruvate formate lyase activating enzyme